MLDLSLITTRSCSSSQPQNVIIIIIIIIIISIIKLNSHTDNEVLVVLTAYTENLNLVN